MRSFKPGTKCIVYLRAANWQGYCHVVVGREGQISKLRFAFGDVSYVKECDPIQNRWPDNLSHTDQDDVLTLREVEQRTNDPATTLPVSECESWAAILTRLSTLLSEDTVESEIKTETSFRSWMERLRRFRGNHSNWPMLLSIMLDTEFRRECSLDGQRDGAVLFDRSQHRHPEAISERTRVSQLFHSCREQSKQTLQVGEKLIWLLSFNVPNQNNGMRAADLVGMDNKGGIVVFECKCSNNDDPPLTALLEGLDYLSHLCRESVANRLSQDFQSLLDGGTIQPPSGFERVSPTCEQRPTIVVLGDKGYFDRYCRSNRGTGWDEVAAVDLDAPSFGVVFAITDYKNTSVEVVNVR